MSQSKLLKKMSAKHIVGNIAKFVEGIEEDGACKEAYRVFGKITDVRTGNSTYGDWTMFKGVFEAIAYDGETFRAGEVAIQEPMESLLLAALREHDEVEFGMIVELKRRDDLERKYEYVVTPIVEPTENDPLAHLRQAALPAPVKAGKKK